MEKLEIGIREGMKLESMNRAETLTCVLGKSQALTYKN